MVLRGKVNKFVNAGMTHMFVDKEYRYISQRRTASATKTRADLIFGTFQNNKVCRCPKM